jgi:hypothetical protein
MTTIYRSHSSIRRENEYLPVVAGYDSDRDPIGAASVIGFDPKMRRRRDEMSDEYTLGRRQEWSVK